MAAIDLQLTYISFIQQLQPNNQNDNISKGFYRILETVSTIDSILALIKIQDDLNKQIKLSSVKNDAMQQQVESLIKSTAVKDEEIKDLLNRPPQIRIVESGGGGFCKIFHMHTKYDNPFLNLTSKEQQKILNEIKLSPEQMIDTVEIIRHETPDLNIYQMFDILL